VPILFNFLTLAWRTQTSIGVGRDEMVFPKYLGRADYVRGYDREQYAAQFCGGIFTISRRAPSRNCSEVGSCWGTSSCDSRWCAVSTSA
jgi:hypothetical protein